MKKKQSSQVSSAAKLYGIDLEEEEDLPLMFCRKQLIELLFRVL